MAEREPRIARTARIGSCGMGILPMIWPVGKTRTTGLLRGHKGGDASVCETLRLLHRFADAPDADILAADLALHDAQFALALDYGFSK